jgi:hypothetical protein
MDSFVSKCAVKLSKELKKMQNPNSMMSKEKAILQSMDGLSSFAPLTDERCKTMR